MDLTTAELMDLRNILGKVSFLQSLKMAELDILLNGMEKTAFRRGEVIIRQGDIGDRFYIVASGKVGFFKTKLLFKTRINTMGPRSFFGEMALLNNAPRSATAIGDEDGELYFLSRKTFDAVLLRNPEISAMIQQRAEYHRTRDEVRGL